MEPAGKYITYRKDGSIIKNNTRIGAYFSSLFNQNAIDAELKKKGARNITRRYLYK